MVFPFFAKNAGIAFAQSNAKASTEGDLKVFLKGKSYDLFFSPEKNGVQIDSVKYSFDFRNPLQMRVGNRVFQMSEFSLLNAVFGVKYRDFYQMKNILAFQWPHQILSSGNLKLVDNEGNILFERELSEKMIADSKNKLESFFKDPHLEKDQLSTYQRKYDFSKYQYFITDQELSSKIFNQQKYRLCLSSQQKKEKVEICSQYMIRNNLGRFQDLPMRTHSEMAGFYILDGIHKNYVNHADIPVKSELNLQIYLSNGLSVKIEKQNPEVDLVEIAKYKNKKIVVGRGPLCQGCLPLSSDDVRDYNESKYYFDILMRGRSFNAPRAYWLSVIKENQDYFDYGSQGFLDSLTYNFKYNELPDISWKPMIKEPKKKSTYLNHVDYVLSDPDTKDFDTNPITYESITPGDIQRDGEKASGLLWHSTHLKQGITNDLYLKMNLSGGKNFVLNHKIYRGYANEVSGRLTGVASSTAGTSILSEVNMNSWFESILGWENSVLSLQRWGLNVRYFRSLVDFKSEDVGDIPLSQWSADLKYRFTPGLWNWDETYGLTLSYQSVEFGPLKGEMYGPGIMWVRSMPKFIDDYLNHFSWFHYPKWVEAEFIYYPFPYGTSTRSVGPTYNLNYRGKILWSNNFYGEAGFGIKKFQFVVQSNGRNAGASLFYATFGLGYQF